MYLQPIKNEDPQLDFYTTYKRETMEYDTECMAKHNEDLNTTLIFVGFYFPFVTALWHTVNHILRLVCSPRLAPPSSSMSSRSSSQTQVNGRKPTSGLFFSASIDPSLRTKTPRLLQHGMDPLQRSLRPLISCTQAF